MAAGLGRWQRPPSRRPSPAAPHQPRRAGPARRPRREGGADGGGAGLRARGGAQRPCGCHGRLPLPAASLKYYGAVAATGAAVERTMRAVIALAAALGSLLLGGCLLRLGGQQPLRAR